MHTIEFTDTRAKDLFSGVQAVIRGACVEIWRVTKTNILIRVDGVESTGDEYFSLLRPEDIVHVVTKGSFIQ